MTTGKRYARDTVLMFEGGGMRASYTSGMASLLMEQGITFDYVCGISAGSSLTVNYLSGDTSARVEALSIWLWSRNLVE